MVWFQCETCGEEFKKPKLPNHFRNCAAYKLSCLDCGVTFDKQTVQSHTQCITESEKYGPKGQGNIANGSAAKPKQAKPNADVDINIGLTTRFPWFCSLCNTKATSQQALLVHADGKKHRAKVRAHTAKQQPSVAVPEGNDSAENNANTGAPDDKSIANNENISSNGDLGKDNSLAKNEDVSAKKRKLDSNGNDSTDNVNKITTEADTQEIPVKLKKAKYEKESKGDKSKKTNHEAEKDDAGAKKGSSKENVKWKKLIASTLKNAPDGALKMKKLQKLIFKSLRDSGITVVDSEFSTILEHKVNSSSKFTIDGKYVKLAV